MDIRHKPEKENVVPDAQNRKHQLKVVYVGKIELIKEVQLVIRRDELAKKIKQNLQKGMDYCGISKISFMF